MIFSQPQGSVRVHVMGAEKRATKRGKKEERKNETCEVEKTEKGIKGEWKCGNKIFNL